MNLTFKNIFAVIAGLLVGSTVNMGIIAISGFIIPPPEGVDLSTTEGLKEAMHLFQPINFLMPFLAHALGTLVGAFVAAKLASNKPLMKSLLIGVFFMVGGLWMVKELASPLWFNVLDLAVAYIPMAFLGFKLSGKKEEQ